MKKPLLIYGAGGLGREVLSFVRSHDEWEPAGFIDDHITLESVDGLKVHGNGGMLNTVSDQTYVVLAVGDPVIKAAIAKRIVNPRITYPVLIHPAAILQHRGSIHLGPGTIVAAGAILTTAITLGAHVLINLNTTVGHDTTIGDHTSVMPGVNIGGQVIIEEGVLIGSGASIRNRITLGSRSKIAMGAVVVASVPAGITVAGVPAKPL